MLRLGKIRQQAFGDEQDARPGKAFHFWDPVIVEHRGRKQDVPRVGGLVQLLAKSNDGGQVDLDPGDRPVVKPIEPRIEASAEIHDPAFWIRIHERPDFAIEDARSGLYS